jgi:hypothetical protein
LFGGGSGLLLYRGSLLVQQGHGRELQPGGLLHGGLRGLRGTAEGAEFGAVFDLFSALLTKHGNSSFHEEWELFAEMCKMKAICLFLYKNIVATTN